MYTAGKDGTKGDPQEYHRPPQRTLKRAEDWAKACNIQQLHQEELPLRHDNIIDPIIYPHCRGLAVVRTEGVVYDLTIGQIPGDQQQQT